MRLLSDLHIQTPPASKHLTMLLTISLSSEAPHLYPPMKRTAILKVHLTQNTFFAKINLCTCWKSIAPFFVLFCQTLAFYRLPNLRKSKHHLVHDRVRRGVGLFLIWRQKLICMHVYKELMRCKSVCDFKSRIDPRPFSLGRVQRFILAKKVFWG